MKTALITGAASGMGRITSLRLAQAGVRVAAFDVNESALEDLRSQSNNISTYVCDVSSIDQVKEKVSQAREDLGAIDRLTHAGAIMPLGKIKDLPAEEINTLMRINYEGTVNMVSQILPKMLESNSGQIILFGSIAGTCPERFMGAYCASKAAVNMYAEILSKELEDTSIRVLLVCPAITNTPLMRFVNDDNSPGSLKQTMKEGKLNDPEVVIDSIEKAIKGNKLICYPTPDAVYATRIRRFFPNYWWKLVSKFN
tara:strand:- start:594 stop:1358 length:765 start_codon:yes stop_codon:yes gene_type:complete